MQLEVKMKAELDNYSIESEIPLDYFDDIVVAVADMAIDAQILCFNNGDAENAT